MGASQNNPIANKATNYQDNYIIIKIIVDWFKIYMVLLKVVASNDLNESHINISFDLKKFQIS